MKRVVPSHFNNKTLGYRLSKQVSSKRGQRTKASLSQREKPGTGPPHQSSEPYPARVSLSALYSQHGNSRPLLFELQYVVLGYPHRANKYRRHRSCDFSAGNAPASVKSPSPVSDLQCCVVDHIYSCKGMGLSDSGAHLTIQK